MSPDQFVAWRNQLLALKPLRLSVGDDQADLEFLPRPVVLDLVRLLEVEIRKEAAKEVDRRSPVREPDNTRMCEQDRLAELNAVTRREVFDAPAVPRQPPDQKIEPPFIMPPLRERLVRHSHANDIIEPPAVLLASVDTPPSPTPAPGLVEGPVVPVPALPPPMPWTGTIDVKALERLRQDPTWTCVELVEVQGNQSARYEIGSWRFTEGPLMLRDGEQLVILPCESGGIGSDTYYLQPEDAVLFAPPWDPDYPYDVQQIEVRPLRTSGVQWKAKVGIFRRQNGLNQPSKDLLSRVHLWS